jgi:hypothetical protein
MPLTSRLLDGRIDMGNDLSRREKAILFNGARSCHVHKMLASEVSFDFSKEQRRKRTSEKLHPMPKATYRSTRCSQDLHTP